MDPGGGNRSRGTDGGVRPRDLRVGDNDRARRQRPAPRGLDHRCRLDHWHVVATTASDDQGRFELSELPPGVYVVSASLAGFDPVSRSPVQVTGGEPVAIDFLLIVSGVEEDVDVQGESGTPLDILDTPMMVETFDGELLDIVPVQGENFDTLLPLMPGVVRTLRGRLSGKGGLGTQTSLRVNSVNVTDPVTGEFGTTLPDDAVETITLLPNPYAAEYGGFSAGIAEVETRRGTDDWTWAVTNFFPSFRFRDGTLQGIARCDLA